MWHILFHALNFTATSDGIYPRISAKFRMITYILLHTCARAENFGTCETGRCSYMDTPSGAFLYSFVSK